MARSTNARGLVIATGAGLLLLTVGGCSTGPRPARSQARAAASVTVHVENSSFHDVRVYLVRGGMREALEVVGAASRRVLRIPMMQLGTGALELVAVPRGGTGEARWVSGVHLFPGDTLEWSIDNSRAVYSVIRR